MNRIRQQATAAAACVTWMTLCCCAPRVQGPPGDGARERGSTTEPSTSPGHAGTDPSDPPAHTAGPDGDKLLGVWELVRYDNIPGHSYPPVGVINLTYRFLPEGKSMHFLPGREGQQYGRGNTPFDKYVPYSLDGDSFSGWLGLTNDLIGTKKLEFTTATSITVTFADGSIATLHRIETDPAASRLPGARCLPFTIRDNSYDPARIAEIKRRLAAPDDGSRAQALGKWFLPSDGGRGKPTSLEFLQDGTFERTDWRGSGPEKTRGVYELHGGVLAVHDMEGSCPQSLVSFADGRMDLSFREGKAMSLWRSADDVVSSPTTVPAFYSFSVVNESPGDLKDVLLTEPKLGMGDIRPYGSSGSMNIRSVFPSVIKAEWTRDGTRQSGELPMAGLVPEGFHVDDITVVVSAGDQVSVRFDAHDGGTVVPGESKSDRRYREATERYRDAVMRGDDRSALKALKRIQSRRARSFFDIRPLGFAIAHGRAAVVKAGLRRGDPNERNPYGRTALGEAARAGSLPVVRALVRAGAAIDPSTDGPLESAASKGHLEVIRYLLKKGADPNREAAGQFPLIGAIRSKDPVVVRMLLDAGANPNIRFGGKTPAEFAKTMRAPEDVIMMLQAASETKSSK